MTVITDANSGWIIALFSKYIVRTSSSFQIDLAEVEINSTSVRDDDGGWLFESSQFQKISLSLSQLSCRLQ